MMKKNILRSIYNTFDSWSLQFSMACRKGCTSCCTQDVMVTAIEAELIIDYITENHLEKWLTTRLDSDLPRSAPSCTTNEFAHACLNDIDLSPETEANKGVCPFLEYGSCSIYPARPFSCRSFASTKLCSQGSSATAPQHYLTATTAVSQIIEHLDQRYFWGNMLHVIYLLAQQNDQTADNNYPENKKRLLLAQSSCMSSKPLPGFLISEEDYPQVEPLIEQIFMNEVDGRRVEDILNNR